MRKMQGTVLYKQQQGQVLQAVQVKSKKIKSKKAF